MRLDCLAPFPLRSATLPLTGENHPLRREFNKWMSWGNASTLMLSLLTLATLLALPKEQAVPKPEVKIVFDGGWETIEEPPITVDRRGPAGPTIPQDKIGIIEPRPLDPDLIPTLPPMDQIPRAFGTGDIPPGTGELPINPPEVPALPGPDVFVAVEVFPEKLRMDAPIYPPLARETGIEGTVILRILVSKEGRVLDCIVMSGNPMLVDAALTAARTAVFSPALQAQKPVAVWVQLPIVFSLK
jgi:TonB family protein